MYILYVRLFRAVSWRHSAYWCAYQLHRYRPWLETWVLNIKPFVPGQLRGGGFPPPPPLLWLYVNYISVVVVVSCNLCQQQTVAWFQCCCVGTHRQGTDGARHSSQHKGQNMFLPVCAPPQSESEEKNKGPNVKNSLSRLWIGKQNLPQLWMKD